VAVHGNDDTAESQRELPFQQVLFVGGRRVLLSHGHQADLAAERAFRVGDEMEPKFAHLAVRARAAGCDMFLFGHWHVPLAVECDGVLLVNAGAQALPSYTSRQTVRSVARIFVLGDGSVRIVHVNLAQPDEAWVPPNDLAAGFKANALRYSESILEPGLEAELVRWRERTPFADRDRMHAALLRAGGRVWFGECSLITRDDLRDVLAG